MFRITNFDQLEALVRKHLCEKADLDPSLPIIYHVLRQRDRIRGVEFTLVAHRSLRLSAIWDALTNKVLLYDQDLERFGCLQIASLSVEHIPTDREVAVTRSVWCGK